MSGDEDLLAQVGKAVATLFLDETLPGFAACRSCQVAVQLSADAAIRHYARHHTGAVAAIIAGGAICTVVLASGGRRRG